VVINLPIPVVTKAKESSLTGGRLLCSAQQFQAVVHDFSVSSAGDWELSPAPELLGDSCADAVDDVVAGCDAVAGE
jgi:hypothetical protein